MSASLRVIRRAQSRFSGTPIDPLARWKAARDSGRAVVVNIGDSIFEGRGTSARSKRWQDLVIASLRTNYAGGAGAQYYQPSWYDADTGNLWRNAYHTHNGTSFDSWSGNISYHTGSWYSAGQGMTMNVTGSSMDIWYTIHSAGGAFTYSVDGGTPVSVNCNGTYQPNARIVGIPLGAAGSHTITFNTTTATGFLSGVSVYTGDANSGIHSYDGGHSGLTAADFMNDSEYGAPASGQALKNTVATINPDLVVIGLGLNDALYGGFTAEQFQANFDQLVTWIQTQPIPPSIMVVADYTPSSMTTAAWGAYVRASSNVALKHGAAFLDLSAVMPQATTSGTGLYTTDGLHPNDSGHAAIASYVLQKIGPTPVVATTSGSAAATVAVASSASGSATTSGQAAGITSVTSSASGSITASGTAAATVAVSSAAAGGRASAGGAAATVSVVSSASGGTAAAGTSAGTVVVASSAAGAAPSVAAAQGTSTGAVAVAVTAAGSVTASGTSSSNVAVTAAASGATTASGASSGTVAVAGAASGARAASGSASGAVSVLGAATGSTTTSGASTGTVAVTTTAAGSTTTSGSSVGAVVLTSAAAGSRVSSGGAAATIIVTSSASGGSGASGASAGTVAVAATAAGSTAPAGTSSGAVDVTGGATGSAPAVGSAAGSSSGSVAVAATAAGSRASAGSASSAVAVTASAAGSRTSSGAALVGVTVTAAAAGARASAGTASGRIDHSGFAYGARGSSGLATIVLTYVVTAAGATPQLASARGGAAGTVILSGSAIGVRNPIGVAHGVIGVQVVALGSVADVPGLELALRTGRPDVDLDADQLEVRLPGSSLTLAQPGAVRLGVTIRGRQT